MKMEKYCLERYEERKMAKYFGTNGVRGIFRELNPMLALRLAQAFGMWCKEGKILVGQDMRLTSECIANAIKSGLGSTGCEVIDLGLCSAPGAEFMLKKESADGLIIITASHNPAEWNALKFVDKNGITISKERGTEIEALMRRIKLEEWSKIKPMKKIEYSSEMHSKAIEGIIDVEKIKNANLKLALDFGNGMSALYADLFKRNAQITAINSHLDGSFPSRPSEPTESNITNLIGLIKKGGYDAGFAWDGDGDRVVGVDEEGEYVIGDKIFALSILLALQKKRCKKIITTVATSRAVEDIAKKYGAKTIYTKVGAPYLSEAMALENAEIGGEEVGGVIWSELSLAKDGLLTTMKVLEGISKKPFSKWIEEIPRYYNAKTKIPVKKQKKEGLIKKFLETVKGERVTAIDGVRVDFSDSWIIARASGTENYIRIFAEAKTKEKAEELVKEYEKIIKKLYKLPCSFT